MKEMIIRQCALGFIIVVFLLIIEQITGEWATFYGWLYWMGGMIFREIQISLYKDLKK